MSATHLVTLAQILFRSIIQRPLLALLIEYCLPWGQQSPTRVQSIFFWQVVYSGGTLILGLVMVVVVAVAWGHLSLWRLLFSKVVDVVVVVFRLFSKPR